MESSSDDKTIGLNSALLSSLNNFSTAIEGMLSVSNSVILLCSIRYRILNGGNGFSCEHTFIHNCYSLEQDDIAGKDSLVRDLDNISGHKLVANYASESF